jgi:thiol-disulfide isomerase/thioredoxin
MNYRLILLFAAIIGFAGCKKNTVTISGTITSPRAGEYIFLDELKSDRLKPVDSTKVDEKGTYNFKFEADQPSFFLVRFNEKNFITLIVEPGENITLESHHDSLNYPAIVKGSEGTLNVVEYNKTLRKTVDELTALDEIYNRNLGSPRLASVIDSLDKLAESYLGNLNAYTKKYINENLGSLETLIVLYQQVAPSVPVLNTERDLAYFVRVDSALFRKYPESEPVQSLHKQVQMLVGLSADKGTQAPPPGERTVAPEIALPTPAGDTVKLSSTRGSVVLLDIWASWCVPCRLESPNLVQAYEKYHRRGFQIYQVSLDKTKEAWIKGIDDDKLGKWIHVSDIKYWQSEVVPLYKIESIPANFLLDKDGNIIARNLRGDALMTKLAEVFGR